MMGRGSRGDTAMELTQAKSGWLSHFPPRDPAIPIAPFTHPRTMLLTYRENAHLTQIGVGIGIGIGVTIEKGPGSLVS
jgi:hypothetical protein